MKPNRNIASIASALTLAVHVSPAVQAATITWDPSGGGISDGAGVWLDTGVWWDGALNVDWTSGDSAIFGNGGAGGNVTLGADTSIGSLTFNSFTGTYQLGTTSKTLTLNGGITSNVGSGTVSIISPIILGGAQSWTNNSGTMNIGSSGGGLDLNGNALTIDGGAGTFTSLANHASNIISGSGGITKTGSGRLVLGGNPAPSHTYSGDTNLNGGVTMFGNNYSSNSNINMNGGVLESYWATNITQTLGAGAGEIRITGGESGFSLNGNTGLTVTLGGGAITWGSVNFDPTKFVLQSEYSQGNSAITFANALDLNGAVRTVLVNSGTTGNASATISGILSNSSSTVSGFIKEGAGTLTLSAANTFDGATTVSAGTLYLTNSLSLQNSVLDTTSSIAGDATNGLKTNKTALTLGGLTGNKDFADVFTTTSGGYTAVTALTLNTGTGTSQSYSGIIANGAATTSLTKTGLGTQVLSGANSYTGGTNVNGGTLLWSGANNLPATGTLQVNNGGNFSLADGTARSTSTAKLGLANGSLLTFDWNGASVDTLTSTAAATTAGLVTIQINNTSPTGSGGTLIDSSLGGLTSGGATYLLANNTNYTATITSTDTSVSIGAQSAVTALTEAYWLGGQVTGALGSMALSDGTTSNWASDAAATSAGGVVPGGGTANVIFGATGATQQSAVTTSADLNLGSLTFNDGTAVTIAGPYAITLNNTASAAATTSGALQTITNAGANAISAISVTSFANANNTINANLALAANQTWNIASGKTLTIGGDVSGNYGLTQDGSGTLILKGANTFAGNTTISGGTLRIGNNNAGTLGNGSYSGNISIASGSTLQIWSSASQILSGIISGAGDLDKAYGGTLTLSGDNTYTGKTTFLPQSTTGFTVNISSFNSVSTNVGLGTVHSASSSLGAPTDVANGTIDVGNSGKRAGVTLNYTGTGETTDRVLNLGFNSSSSQTISSSGTGLLKFTSAVTSNANGTHSGTLILDGTGVGEFAQGLPTLPTGGLRKNGSGTWILNGTNSYGNTYINGAVGSSDLIFQGTASAPSGGTITLNGLSSSQSSVSLLADGASNTFATTIAFDQRNSSTGLVVNIGNTGAGTGGGTATNATTYVDKFSFIANQGTTGGTNGASAININDGYTLKVGAVQIAAVANNITNTKAQLAPVGGSMEVTGTVQQDSGNPVATDNVILQLAGTSSGNLISGNILDAADYTDLSNLNARELALNKINTSTWTLSGANTYTGGTAITGGTLTFLNTNAKASTGTHAFSAGTTLGLGVSGANAFTSTDVDNAFSGTMTGNLSNVTVAATTNVGIDTTNGDFTYSSDITGSPTRGLSKLGQNTLMLSGTNTYTGNTTVSAGILNTTKALALAGYTTSGKVIIDGGTLGVQVGGSGWTTGEVDTMLANATKTSGALGVDTTNGNLTQWTSFTTTNLGSTLGLTKLGSNTLTLDQANTYTGATSVLEGTLLVDGNISTSSLTTVASGATIGGSGTIGALTVSSGGFINPGNSPGILSIDGDYVQAGLYTAEINGLTVGAEHDQIDAMGAVDIAGGSLSTLFSGTYSADDLIFILLNDGGDAITGTYSGFAQGDAVTSYGGFNWNISYEADSVGNTFIGGNDIALQAVLIPEPSVALLSALSALLLFRRRR